MSVDFTPSRGEYTELKPFRYWCQKVLPLVYDDSLSYYELLSKVLDSLNKAMEDVETLNDDVTALYTAYDSLQNWVNDYVETFFEGEGIANAVDDALDRMVVSGEFGTIVNDKVAAQINAVVASQIGGTVQTQLPGVVSTQINPVVANQLPGVVNNKIGDVADAWLQAHVQSQTGTLDHTINSSGSAPLSFPLKNLIQGQGVKGSYSFIDKYLLADYTDTGYHNDVIIFRNIFKDNFNPPDYPYPARSKFYKKGNKLIVTSYPDPSDDNPWEINAYPSVIPITRNLIPPLNDSWDASTNDAVALTLSGLSGLDKNAISKYFVNINSWDTIRVAFDLNLTYQGNFNGSLSLTGWKLVKVYVSNGSVTYSELADFNLTQWGTDAGLYRIHGECEYTFDDIDKETPGNPDTIGFGLAIVTGEEIAWGHYSGNTNYMMRSNTYELTITGEVSGLNEDVNKLYIGSTYAGDKDGITVERGGFTTTTGSPTTNIKYCRTPYAKLISNNVVTVYFKNSTYMMGIYGYNADNSLIGRIEPTISNDGFFFIPSTYPYFKLFFKRVDNADMSSTDYTDIESSTILFYSRLDETLKNENLPANSKAVGDRINTLLNTNNLLQGGTIKENYYYRGYEDASTDYSYFIIPVTINKTYVLTTKCRFLSSAENMISQNLSAESTYTATYTGDLYITFYNEDRDSWSVYENTINPADVPSYDSIEIKSNGTQSSLLKDKVWYACGDSFTQGDFEGYNGQYRFTDAPYFDEFMVYPFYIGRRTGAVIKNLAVGGMTMAVVSGSTNNFIETYQNVGSDADYITLKFGINDGHRSVPIGTIDSVDTSTFYGAWNTVMTWLITNRPTAKIGIIVSNGLDANTYADATIAIANKYGVPYLNEWSGEQVPLMLRSGRTDVASSIKAIRDETFRVSETNQHPNPISHKYESTIVENFLLSL